MSDLIFNNARDAVSWAEEYATRPDIDSQLLVKSPGFGGLTPHEMRDLALTICAKVTNTDKPKGYLFAYVYGNRKNTMMAYADPIAHILHLKSDGLKKDIAKLRALACVLSESIRRHEQYDRPLSRRRISKNISVSKSTYFRDWIKIEGECYSILKSWLSDAEKKLDDEFDNMGILG